MSAFDQLKQRVGDGVKQNEPLANHTWFKIGGPATYFYSPSNNDDFVRALKAGDELGLKVFILGGGSNLLVSDAGFDGFVIQPKNTNFKISDTAVYCESGVLVVDLLAATLAAGLTGWAWAAGLPGTVGGAIRGNAGAYGKGMSDIVTWVEVYENGHVVRKTNTEMEFSYRHSVAKERSMVVIAAELVLERGNLEEDKRQVAAYLERRKTTQPLEYPNSGCIFKNIDFSEVQIDADRVMKGLDVSQAEWNEATKFNKLPVSFILDHLGLKGKKIGGAQVSEKHAAFIVNIDHATAEEVIMLISAIKSEVRARLGIQLQEEVQYVGF